MVELEDLFPEFEFSVEMGSILVSCSTGCASLFPEFELFVGMGSILVSCSSGCASLFPEFELFVGMGSILVSWVLLAMRVYFQNLNFCGDGFDPRQLFY
jgi:hypothetical protein